MTTGPRPDLPEPGALTRPYWEAVARGRLLIRRCGACGRATLYTWSAVHHNDLPPFTGRTPYLAAVVDLAEGPRMMTEPVDCPPDAVRAGMPLTVTFRDGIPVFRPAVSPS
ncbi:OB-fold domain-containing protein [Streptomyces lavenduligriseus]|nr:OB-fold domain-containing protein [Streptomyces lavenduligriseus]